jgi:hypothetical protein
MDRVQKLNSAHGWQQFRTEKRARPEIIIIIIIIIIITGARGSVDG